MIHNGIDTMSLLHHYNGIILYQLKILELGSYNMIIDKVLNGCLPYMEKYSLVMLLLRYGCVGKMSHFDDLDKVFIYDNKNLITRKNENSVAWFDQALYRTKYNKSMSPIKTSVTIPSYNFFRTLFFYWKITRMPYYFIDKVYTKIRWRGGLPSLIIRLKHPIC